LTDDLAKLNWKKKKKKKEKKKGQYSCRDGGVRNKQRSTINFPGQRKGGTVEYVVEPAREINSKEKKYIDWVTQRKEPERTTQEI